MKFLFITIIFFAYLNASNSSISVCNSSLLEDASRCNEEMEFKKYLQEMKKLNSSFKVVPTNIVHDDLISQIKSYDKLIIEVDSKHNIMFLKANANKNIINIKSYKVSTAKSNIKKPLGIGFITSISLKPQWYPTIETLRTFKQKGITLPSVVPYGHNLNYMGAAKINLSHKVNGNEVYRIHGTLNEKTIGTNESSGCIRMKNNEVVQLANILNEFANFKDYSNIRVIVK